MILKVSDVKVRLSHRTFKVGNYFKLKFHTPLLLVSSNIVHRCTYQYNTSKTYVGMLSRRLVTRKREYFNLSNSRKSAVKDHLPQCKSCSKYEIDLHSSFTVLKKCPSQYNAKIYEALLIKQSKLLLINSYSQLRI